MTDPKIEQLEAVDSMTIRCPFEHGNPDKTGLLFAKLPAWRHQDDARRAAASWNACLDFDIETLELAAKVGGLKIALDSHNAALAHLQSRISELERVRGELAEAQADNAAMHSAAHRLALEAECFYLDCKDMALVSKWDDHLQTAISDVQAIRWDGDTSALSAAIAGQQKEIDRLRLLEKSNIERWQHENKSVERTALAAFSVLNHPESPECHFELKQAVMAMGFCPRCEWRPCECEGKYDD